MRQPNFFSNGCLSLGIQLNGVMHNIFNLWFEKNKNNQTQVSQGGCAQQFFCVN